MSECFLMNDLPDLAAPFQTLAHTVAQHFARLPKVAAVALAGSQTSGVADALSDIDLYVYTRSEIALAKRQTIIEATGGATHANVGMTFWGAGDEWTNAPNCIQAKNGC